VSFRLLYYTDFTSTTVLIEYISWLIKVTLITHSTVKQPKSSSTVVLKLRKKITNLHRATYQKNEGLKINLLWVGPGSGLRCNW